MLAMCEVVCDQYTIPTPDIQAGLRFTGVRRIKTGKVDRVEDMVAEAFIWAGDALVYECEQPQYGIMGGVDTVLDRCDQPPSTRRAIGGSVCPMNCAMI